jgi:RNA polymerase sigma-70 factor (ECF subfamily)
MRAARAGDGAALGVLLERHRPRLLAAALRILGHRPDAEDAVQETFLMAVRHIDALREPDAVGAWLHAILRRACLQLRRRGEQPAGPLPEVPDRGATPEERIERSELRDWIWGALQRIPEPLRVTAMLRYFGSYDSYDELAAILGIPIGTVRSRLSEARVKLAEALLASAGLIDDESRTPAPVRARFWFEAFRDVFRWGEDTELLSHFASDILVVRSHGTISRGREHLAVEIEEDLAAGVRLDPQRVIGGDGIAVLEGRFANPPESPHHCPPGIALVLFESGDRADRVHLHLSPRPPGADPDAEATELFPPTAPLLHAHPR